MKVHKMLGIPEKQQATFFSKKFKEGWSIKGNYRTRVTATGKNILLIEASMKMKAKKALLTACAIGSYSEQSSEVLQCNWDPDRLPKGWCKAYHVAQNIKQIKENWS